MDIDKCDVTNTTAMRQVSTCTTFDEDSTSGEFEVAEGPTGQCVFVESINEHGHNETLDVHIMVIPGQAEGQSNVILYTFLSIINEH